MANESLPLDDETLAGAATGTTQLLERAVVARNPEVQSFVRRLRVGDQVDLVYEEALAISVEPMR